MTVEEVYKDSQLVPWPQQTRHHDFAGALESACLALTSHGFIFAGADRFKTPFAIKRWGMVVDMTVSNLIHIYAQLFYSNP